MNALKTILRNLFRAVFFLGVVPATVGSVILFVSYQRAAEGLATLNSEYDIERELRHRIEGERRALRGEAGIVHNEVKWPRPTLSDYPHEFLLIYLGLNGCPSFFQTPRETPTRWAWRVLNAAVFERTVPGRDGECELAFSLNVARHMGVKDPGPQAVAAYRLRQVMQRDQLVAYDLAAVPVEQGYYGVQEASMRLLRRPLSVLTLAEEAELAIALPPLNFWLAVRACDDPMTIKQARDSVLEILGVRQLVTPERARAAQGEPLSCVRS
jgi:hypothetical protein